MSRDHTKLTVFAMADPLVDEIYRRTSGFPVEERYGLQSQMRRAALSVPTNIVEGCARKTERDFLNSLDVALGSACEVRYLVTVSARLEILSATDREYLFPRYDELARALSGLMRSFSFDSRSGA